MTRADDNPAAICRDSLSRGSYWAVHHSLETIVKLLRATDPWTDPWHRLRYRETARVRAALVELAGSYLDSGFWQRMLKGCA